MRLLCLFSMSITKSILFDLAINALIIYYCLSYTVKKARSDSLYELDSICLAVFIFEYFLRYMANGFFTAKTGLLRNNFHIYDLIIIVLATFFTFFFRNTSHYNLLIFRFIRILLIIPFKHLTALFSGIFSCILQLTQIYLFFLIFCSIFAFLGMSLFSQDLQYFCLDYSSGIVSQTNCGEFEPCPEAFLCVKTFSNPDNNVTHFNDFLHAFLQVIRVITFDNWSSLFKHVRVTWRFGAYFFFLPLTIFGNFVIINMFLAVLKAEFEDFQKNNSLMMERNKLELIGGKNSNFLALSRISSFGKRDKVLGSFLQMQEKDLNILFGSLLPKKSSISKIQIQKNISFLNGMASGNLGEITQQEENTRFYRRFIMKALHFEKYSQRFASFFDRLSDFLSEVWDSYFVENILKFPLCNIIDYTEKGSFYSSEDVLIRKTQKKFTNHCFKIETQVRYRNLHFDVRKYLELEQLQAFFVPPKQRVSLPIDHRRITFFKQKVQEKGISSPKSRKVRQNVVESLGTKTMKRASMVKGDVDTAALANYEDVKKMILENLLKISKKEAKNPENKQPISKEYYDILEHDLRKKAISVHFWSGNDVFIRKIPLRITLQLIQMIYQSPLLMQKLLSFRDRILYKFQLLIDSPIYQFLIVSINGLNISIIAFGDYFFEQWLQDRLLDICFLLFLTDFGLKILANTGMHLYLKNIYNIFDFLCLWSYALHKILESLNYIDNLFKSSRFLMAIQPLRAFRFLQYFSFMRTIQLVIIKTFNDYLPLAIILFVFLYIFTLFGIQLFNRFSFDSKQAQKDSLNFRDFFFGLSTCFSILTLDNWYNFMVLYMSQSNTGSIVLFTLVLFLFGNFVLLDLFIAAMLHGFEFICLKQVQPIDDQSPEKVLIQVVYNESKRSSEKKKNSNFELYRKMTQIMTFFSLYWKLKQERIARFMKKFSSHAMFNKLVYVMIWFCCVEMIYESYYLNYWNYDSEIQGFFFWLNTAINAFFGFEVMLKFYTAGFQKNMSRNLISLMEIGFISGFFSYFLFKEKNILIQVIHSRYILIFDRSLKVALILKFFRPLRLIDEHINFRKIRDFFIQSISGVFNVIPIILLVWCLFSLFPLNFDPRFIFAILGVNLYRGRFGYCEIPTNFEINESTCDEKGKHWVLNEFNFDNIPNALISLFVIATFDNWISILEVARNSDLANKGPSQGNNAYSSYLYFFSFIIISVLFLINLFLGIMFVKFQLAEKAGGRHQDHFSENQEKWVQMQSRILSIEPYETAIANVQGIRKYLVNLLTSAHYSFIMSIFPLTLFFILMLENHDLLRFVAADQKKMGDIIIILFAGIFSFEVALKLLAFSIKGYFIYKWNIIEFVIAFGYVTLAIAESVIDNSDSNSPNKTMKILRILRILPIFRLFHRFKFLRKMKQTITFKIPTIMSILSLLALFLLVYALLGVYFFHDIDIDSAQALDESLNFQDVFSAMMTLFVCATGENWSLTLIDAIDYTPKCQATNYLCGSYVAVAFFISFMIFIHLIFLNLLTLVIITQFESLHKNPLNPEIIFVDNVNYFKKAWAKFSENTDKISRTKLIEFFRFLGPPLGVHRTDNFFAAASKVMKMEIRSDTSGFINFHSLLHATMKNFFYEKLGLENAKAQILQRLEVLENNFFVSVNKKTRSRKSKTRLFLQKAKFTFREKENPLYIKINPFNDYLNLLMCFLSWRNYSLANQRRLESQDNGNLLNGLLVPEKSIPSLQSIQNGKFRDSSKKRLKPIEQKA